MILALLLLSTPSYAMTHDELVHFTAHSGASFAIHSTLYGVNSKWLGMGKGAAKVVAVVETLAVGLAYKAAQKYPANTGASMAQNAVGVAGALLVQASFEF